MNVHPGKLHKAVAAADMLTAREVPVLIGRYDPDDWRGGALALEFTTKDGLFGCFTVPREGGAALHADTAGALVQIGPVHAFLSKHPAVAPVTPFKVKVDGLDLHVDADGDTMWFVGQASRKARMPKEPDLPEDSVAAYEGSPSELVSDGLPVELRPAWGDRLPVAAFAIQQVIGLLQPAAVMTSIYEQGNKAFVRYSGQRDGLTLTIIAPLRDVEAR